MLRSERLLMLLQILRCHRHPVSGKELSEELGISIRTLYRDIASLQAQGAEINGEPGIGYLIKPGFMLPPLMFSVGELDALVLGMRLVAEQGDQILARAATTSLAKISAVLPGPLREELENSTLLIGAGRKVPAQVVDIERLRSAIRERRKVTLGYVNPDGESSERIVWPFALVYFDLTRILMCWCEQLGAFRNFRTDRITSATLEDVCYPPNQRSLLAEWRRKEYVPGKSILPETDSTGW